MMHLKACIILAVLQLVAADCPSHVSVLSRNNYTLELQHNDFVFVQFYAPWCTHCKILAPEFEKAAHEYPQHLPCVKFVKVDATEDPELADVMDIISFPTLILLRKGTVLEYSGNRTAESIVNWLTKKLLPTTKHLKSIEDIHAFMNKSNMAVIGFFSDLECPQAKEYMTASDSMDHIDFGIVTDSSFNESGKVIIYKAYDERYVELSSNITEKDIRKFVQRESLPLVVDYTQEVAEKIFSVDIPNHLLYFWSAQTGQGNDSLSSLHTVAKKFKHQILFLSINVDDANNHRICDFVGINITDIPTIRIVKLEERITKYKPEKTELTPENVEGFIQDFLDNKLKQNLRSAILPEDWDKNPVKVLVSSNFDQVAFDDSKDVLVEFYAPWCSHCRQFSPIYDELGQKFNDTDTVVIAKIDSTANELDHVKINTFPTLMLFTKNGNKMVEYAGERTVEGLTKFVLSGEGYSDPDVEEKALGDKP